jgi:hypothetical protein
MDVEPENSYSYDLRQPCLLYRRNLEEDLIDDDDDELDFEVEEMIA